MLLRFNQFPLFTKNIGDVKVGILIVRPDSQYGRILPKGLVTSPLFTQDGSKTRMERSLVGADRNGPLHHLCCGIEIALLMGNQPDSIEALGMLYVDR